MTTKQKPGNEIEAVTYVMTVQVRPTGVVTVDTIEDRLLDVNNEEALFGQLAAAGYLLLGGKHSDWAFDFIEIEIERRGKALEAINLSRESQTVPPNRLPMSEASSIILIWLGENGIQL